MEHTIQEVARAAGTTTRTLRHYDQLGLVRPSRTGSSGYRYYDERALVRLQRVLLLKELGLGLTAIGDVLAAQDAQAGPGLSPAAAEAEILTAHLELLRAERARTSTQISAVERTIAALTARAAPTRTDTEDLMSQNMFAGFDHAQHRDEVASRWGEPAAAASEQWWQELSPESKEGWLANVHELNAAWIAASERGVDPHSEEAQRLAARHVAWLRSVPGTPAQQPGGDLAGYVRGLGEMYVADERFAANYGGVAGATLVRDALTRFVAQQPGSAGE